MEDERGSDRRIKLGVVGVDSGALIVIDPCYLKSELNQADDRERSVDLALDLAQTGFGAQLNYKAGHPGLAVAFSSGFGDGVYEVWATIRDCGKWGERVVKVEVDLVSDDTDDEEQAADDR